MKEHSLTRTITARPLGYALSMRDAYDLLLLSGLAILSVLLQVYDLLWLRLPLGLGLTLFGPGYALLCLLFPQQDDLDGFARGALSFAMSVAQLPLLILLLDRTPWGFQPWLINRSLSALIILLCCGAALQRGLLRAAGTRTRLVAPAFQSWWLHLSRMSKVKLVIATLIGCLIVGGAGQALAVHLHKPTPNEFYLLGSEGLARDFPRVTNVGSPVQVTMGITNYEAALITYRLEVWVADPWQTGQRQRILSESGIHVQPGERRQQVLTWHMPYVGDDQQVELLLFRTDETVPYRRLSLWMQVTE